MDELYELAKEESGTITVYATTTDASTAAKKFAKTYPDLKIEYIGPTLTKPYDKTTLVQYKTKGLCYKTV